MESPAPGLQRDYHDLLNAFGERDPEGGRSLIAQQFPRLEAYSAATHNDRHSILVGYDAFEKVTRLNAKDRSSVQKLYNTEDFDFRLKPGSAPADKGVIIPNVTDNYNGAAPDLGALELGQAVPHYSPRPDTPDTE